MSGIGSRSPFPSRGRRMTIESTGTGDISESFSSPLFLNRPSPSTSYISPRRGFPMLGSNRNSSNPKSTSRDDENDEIPTACPMDLEEIKALAQNCLDPPMSVFYAGILYAKTNDPKDAYFYALTLQRNHEYKRAAKILAHANLVPGDLESVLLTASCLTKLGDWTEAMRLLEEATPLELDDDDELGWLDLQQQLEGQPPESSSTNSSTIISPVSRLCSWRAKVYDETSHPPRAKLFWKRALRIDPKNVQAYDSLVTRNLLTPKEANDLIQSLKLNPSLGWLKTYYTARIPVSPQDTQEPSPTSADDHPSFAAGVDASSIQLSTPSIHMKTKSHIFGDTNIDDDEMERSHRKAPPPIERPVDDAIVELWNVHGLSQSSEVLALAATRAFRRYDMQTAFEYCQELNNLDPLCEKASFVYAATLLALDHKRLLFAVAHDWVEAAPKSSRAWFAVGCYYYSCQKYHVAQKHFCRATRLDPLCFEAWLAFGCSFAACDESDQALAAFRAAQRLAPAEPSALLYMGMEYVRTNHLILAQHSLMAALSSGDPLCYHELGVAAFCQKDYTEAIPWFVKALRAVTRNPRDYVEDLQNDFWEPTLLNLGHCYRKIRQFGRAMECFEKCLVLVPDNPSSLLALGLTKHLAEDYDGAIELYHQALSRKPDDPVGLEALNRALEEALSVKLDISRVVKAPRNQTIDDDSMDMSGMS